ncbi:MAG: tetratricopeptide repeat protein, partial [Planctomycetota bacterium]|nr:tetratricopeptide repeat protein [Planctomycetota bacterium]
MSHLLEMLARGLEHDPTDVLDRYFWSPGVQDVAAQEARRRGCSWSAESQLPLGLACLREGKSADAVEHLSAACGQEEGNVSIHTALAAALLEAGRPTEALVQLEAAERALPCQAPVLFVMGLCLERLERPEEAAVRYRQAIEQDGTFVAARYRLAAVGIVRGQLDEAIRQYEALRNIEPQYGWIRSALAHLYFRAGKSRRAAEEFQAAIAIEPENWALMDDEVEALVADGSLREAIERLHSLLEEQGAFADVYVRLADLYSRTGDDEAAMEHYRSALDMQPTYLEAHVKSGTHHLMMGRWEQAAEEFHEASELNDRVLANYIGLGVAQAAAGERAEAVQTFELAGAIEPNTSLLVAEMARMQLKAAVAEEFLRTFDVTAPEASPVPDMGGDTLLERQLARHAEQIEQHPEYADVRYRYGVLLRSEGRTLEALDQFTEAVRINPGYTQAMIKLGITQQELGEADAAVETFRRALDLAPEYVDVHYRLALLHTD